MAKANYNATLEYATNTLEFWLLDDAGDAQAFDVGTTLNIERKDDNSKKNVFTCVLDSAGEAVDYHATVVVTPSEAILRKEDDNTHGYDKPAYLHIWSLKSPDNVYITGEMNLVEVAG